MRSSRARSANLVLAFVLGAAAAAAAFAQDSNIDVARSTITIHVSKAGLLSAAGHDHLVAAPIASGVVRESPDPRTEFTIQTAAMKVKEDPKVSEKDHAQIQKDMEDMTLEIAKFPQIAFKSTRVEKSAEGQWKVDGDLSLHGVTKQVTLLVKRSGEFYSAHTVLKQTDFGIKPVSVGGGMIKVKNELDIDFQIYTARRN